MGSSLRSACTAFVALVAGVLALPRPARAEWPTLDRSMSLAKARAIEVVQAQGDVKVAQGGLTGAKVPFLGNPYLEVQVDRGTVNKNVQALGFLYFPMDILGQRGARIEEAEKMIKWREIALQVSQASSGAEAAATWGEIVLSHERVTLATRGEDDARAEAKYFEGRLAASDTTIYEKSLADAEVARWLQLRVESDLKLLQAKARMVQLTGILSVDDPPTGQPVQPPALRGPWTDGHVTRVLARSPVLNELEKQREFHEASTDRYKAERLPQISLELIGGRGDVGETRYGGGFVLGLPVTRRFQGEIAQAEAGRETAVAQAAVYRRLIQARLVAARDTLQKTASAVKELDERGLPALERAVSASQEAYKLGKIELSRVLLARRDLATARTRRLDLLELAWRSYGELVQLSGDTP